MDAATHIKGVFIMNKKTGYICLILTFFIWGSLYVVSKYAMETMPPLVVLAGRYLFSVIALYLIMKRRGFKKIKKEHRKMFFGVGFLGYFTAIACQLMGTHMIDASTASLINSLNPVIMPIIAALFLNERINIRIGISIALAVIGVYIIVGTGSGGEITPLGLAVNILSVVLWSASSCMVRGISADYDPIQISLYAMSIALIFTIPAAIIDLRFEPCTITAAGIVSTLYIALVCTALSHTLWNKSLKLLDATTCSLFYPIQPLTSALLGILILGEQITLSFVIGAIIICAGILFVVINPKKVSA